MEKNRMICLQTLQDAWFNRHQIEIPLIQRNYKWDSSTAAKLAEDLLKAWKDRQEHYTIGMITLHQVRDDEKALLVDGQQRVITLILLLRGLGVEQEPFRLWFQRDKGLSGEMVTRRDYLQNPGTPLSPEESYTDLERFQENYREIKKVLEKAELAGGGDPGEKGGEFARYIYEHVYVLLHMASQEPLDEFMNINCNKTRFGITDYIRAYQIMDARDMNVERETVTGLFRSLAGKLYSDKTELWSLVSRGYEEGDGGWPVDRNRLDVMFCHRYTGNDIHGYKADHEFCQISWHNRLLDRLLEDWEHGNWNSARAFLCLRELEDKEATLFFKLTEIPQGDSPHSGEESLERRILRKFEKMGCFKQNCFIQTQFMDGKPDMGPGVSLVGTMSGQQDGESNTKLSDMRFSDMKLPEEWERARCSYQEEPGLREEPGLAEECGLREEPGLGEEPGLTEEPGLAETDGGGSWIWNGREDWEDFVTIYQEYLEEKYPGTAEEG